jgi:subtilisin family serine protease
MKYLLFAVIFCVFGTISVQSEDNNYVPGEIIVMLKAGESVNKLSNTFGFMGLVVKEPVVEYMNIWLYKFDNSRVSAQTMLNEVKKHPSVSVVQFNHYVTERSVTPNDTRFGEMWGLNNTGQTGGTVDADIDAPEAWNLSTGGLTAAGDTIASAVIDGGFHLTHTDMNFWKNWYEVAGNGIDDDSNGYIDDVNGWNAYNNNGNVTSSGTHGTHVSGTIGARGNNNLGVTGVNWNLKVVAIQGSSGTEAIVLRAYGYALKLRRMYNQTNGVKGAFIVSTNSSFGVDYGQPANFPLWCAFYDSLGNAGILSACATANLNINVDVQGDIPTACPSDWMVAVTNTTNTDAKNSGAAYGLTTIDLGAPGTSVLSTTSASTYGTSTGTSMATPHVAGAIAFMYSVAPLSWIQQYKVTPGPYSLQVKQKIMQGVDIKPSMVNTVSGGRLNLNNSAILMQNLVSIGNPTNEVPALFRLYQNYPNPFNPSTVLAFDMPKEGFASLKIYNSIGQEVAVLIDGIVKAGSYQKVFNASALPSGIYFYKFVTDGFSDVRKMSLIK